MGRNLELSFVLKAKGGKETAGIIALSASNVKRLSNEIAKQGQVSEKSFSKTRKGVESISRQLQSAKRDLIGFFSIRAGLGLAKDILDVNRQMEKLRTQLTALEGSRSAGQAAFGFIQDFAQKTPFQLEQLTKTFIDLKNFGIEPTAQVMEAITNQASKLGGSQETLQGITLALGQAWAKGKLQGEEILQLVERGVPVYKLLADATGKNVQQLQDMQQKGQLTRDVISQLIVKMGEMASGSNAAQMDTLNGKISNLSDAWHQFEDALLNDKSEGLIKDIVSGATSALNEMTGAIQRMSDLSSGAIGQTDAIGKLNVKIVEQKQLIKELKEGDLFGINESRIKAENIKLENLLSDRVVLLEKYRADLSKNSAQQANDKTFTPNLKIQQNNQGSNGNIGGSNPAKSVIDNLKRQVALYGETSQAAKVRYEIEHGSLQNISDSQKQVILNYAKQLDLLKQQQIEEQNNNDIIAQGIELARQQRLEREQDQQRVQSVKSFLIDNNQSELDRLRSFYDEKRQIIIDSTTATEDEKNRIVNQLTASESEQRKQIIVRDAQFGLNYVSRSFEQLTAAERKRHAKKSALAKAAFEAQKSIAIAQTIMSTYQGAQQAFTSFSQIPIVGTALGIAAAAAVVAAGLSRVNEIRSQSINTVAGAAHGGLSNVPKEQTYLLNKGERVLSPNQNSDLTTFLKNSRRYGNKPQNSIVINITSPTGSIDPVSLTQLQHSIYVGLQRAAIRNG